MNEQNTSPDRNHNLSRTDFYRRSPSVNWEPIPLFPASPSSENSSIIWAWFKPQGIANQISISIPPETFQAIPEGQNLTLLQLLPLIQIDASQLAGISFFGTLLEISGQDHPIFHQPIQIPTSEMDPSIHLRIKENSEITSGESTGNTVAVLPTIDDEQMKLCFSSIAQNWAAVHQIEVQLKGVRKQLDNLLGQLNSLNRDLSPDENSYADRMDVREWQDARRWLRDMASKVSRYLKEYDIGTTSNAGGRLRLEQIYQQFVVPNLPFEGADQVAHEFESYRKTFQNLMQSMSTTVSSARIDGVQRAQQILNKIAAKARTNRNRK